MAAHDPDRDVAKRKANLSRLPPRALAAMARVLEYDGDRHYAEGDWLGGDSRRHVDAALRHLLELVAGRDFDPSSRELVLAHVATRAAMALELELVNLEDGSDLAPWRIYSPDAAPLADSVVCLERDAIPPRDLGPDLSARVASVLSHDAAGLEPDRPRSDGARAPVPTNSPGALPSPPGLPTMPDRLEWPIRSEDGRPIMPEPHEWKALPPNHRVASLRALSSAHRTAGGWAADEVSLTLARALETLADLSEEVATLQGAVAELEAPCPSWNNVGCLAYRCELRGGHGGPHVFTVPIEVDDELEDDDGQEDGDVEIGPRVPA